MPPHCWDLNPTGEVHFTSTQQLFIEQVLCSRLHAIDNLEGEAFFPLRFMGRYKVTVEIVLLVKTKLPNLR